MVLDRVSPSINHLLSTANFLVLPFKSVIDLFYNVGIVDVLEQSGRTILAIQIPSNPPAQSMGDIQEDYRQPHQEWSNESRHETSSRRAQVRHAQAYKGCHHQYVPLMFPRLAFS
jgi:hypothetical protein